MNKKQIKKLKAGINPIERVSYRILEDDASNSLELFLEELRGKSIGLQNVRLGIVYDYGNDSHKYDIRLQLTGEKQRTKEEIEEELSQLIARKEEELKYDKKRKEDKLENDRKVYERLKKKFGTGGS